MLELQKIVHQLAQKDEVSIDGELYKLKNIISATDGEILKTRFILEGRSHIDNIEIDVAISAKIYKR